MIDYLSSRLPKWWLPDDVIFVKTLPMTASGKIRKAELRDAIVAYGPLALPEASIGGTGNWYCRHRIAEKIGEKRMSRKCRSGVAVMATTLLIAGGVSAAEKKYGPGVSDTEIKLGQTVPYSGPASAFSSYGRTMTGYFQMINDGGGINGRKINLISRDNAFSPHLGFGPKGFARGSSLPSSKYPRYIPSSSRANPIVGLFRSDGWAGEHLAKIDPRRKS